MKQLSEFSTYRTGILQARAYRNLRKFLDSNLKDESLTSSEWSILGVVSEETAAGGIRVSAIAKMLDVETSFVTNMVKKLLKNKYVSYGLDEDDGRVRLVVATNHGLRKAQELEIKMRSNMKQWLGDVEAKELIQYIAVLEKLSSKVEVDS